MEILSNEEIENLKLCGKILSNALKKVVLQVKPGITTAYLDQVAEKELRKSGALPSFLNYGEKEGKPFPASLCVSINDEIVHGIPSGNKIIHQGDLVGLDLGAVYNKVCTDMAVTVVAGSYRSDEDKKLVTTAAEALNAGIKHAIPSNTTGDVGNAIQKYVESKGFSVIRALVGHGIGKSPHQEPQIPNFGRKGEGIKLAQNLAIAIEPMIAAGHYNIKTSSDGWTVKTADGKRAAHFEHTILVNKGKPIVVTL